MISIGTEAKEKIAQKTVNITAMKATQPVNQWSRTESSLSERLHV